MKKSSILLDEDIISIITIKGNNSLNIIDYNAIKELNKIIKKVKINKDVRVLIIKGYGDKSFSSGANIEEFSKFKSNEIDEYVELGTETYLEIENLNIPVIACINGYALGAGFELALTCDIRFLSSNSIVGQPANSLGLIPPFGGTTRLPKIVGIGIAKEFIFGSIKITAEEALKIGLANKVFPPEKLLEETLNYSKRIVKNKHYAIKFSKELINKSYYQDILNLEKKYLSECLKNIETKNTLLKFLNKKGDV
ncbi:MAG: crotonase [Candidatus Sericytochromatia bacterium]|nr:MAG: crotonase [Candidatus Sericytochromatia bacterium]